MKEFKIGAFHKPTVDRLFRRHANVSARLGPDAGHAYGSKAAPYGYQDFLEPRPGLRRVRENQIYEGNLKRFEQFIAEKKMNDALALYVKTLKSLRIREAKVKAIDLKRNRNNSSLDYWYAVGQTLTATAGTLANIGLILIPAGVTARIGINIARALAAGTSTAAAANFTLYTTAAGNAVKAAKVLKVSAVTNFSVGLMRDFTDYKSWDGIALLETGFGTAKKEAKKKYLVDPATKWVKDRASKKMNEKYLESQKWRPEPLRKGFLRRQKAKVAYEVAESSLKTIGTLVCTGAELKAELDYFLKSLDSPHDRQRRHAKEREKGKGKMLDNLLDRLSGPSSTGSGSDLNRALRKKQLERRNNPFD